MLNQAHLLPGVLLQCSLIYSSVCHDNLYFNKQLNVVSCTHIMWWCVREISK